MKKSKSILIFMAALLLASSVFLFSCGDKEKINNIFVGTWVSSQLRTTYSQVPATLIFTNSEWTLTVPSLSITEKGDYFFPYSGIDYRIVFSQGGSNVGEAIISGGSLSFFSSISGTLDGASGQFTKQ